MGNDDQDDVIVLIDALVGVEVQSITKLKG